MKTNVTYTREELISGVTRLCAWIESDEGWNVLLRKDDRDCFGQMAQSKLTELRSLLTVLLNNWPDPVVIDLSWHDYPINAGCEVAEVLQSVEKELTLAEGTFQCRVHILDALSAKRAEDRAILEAQEEQFVRTFLQRPPSPLYPFEPALKSLDAAIIH